MRSAYWTAYPLSVDLLVLSREQGLSIEHFGKNATDTPDIDSLLPRDDQHHKLAVFVTRAHLGVLLEAQHHFGSTVPPCRNVFGHDTVHGTFLMQGSLCRPGKTKVTDLIEEME
jgi:hypothetical protein